MRIFDDGYFEVHKLVLNKLKTNCYIISTDLGAILLDPTADSSHIIDYIKKNQIDIKYVVATHGHFDHIGAAAEVISEFSLDGLYAHPDEFNEIKRSNLYSKLLGEPSIRIPDNVIDINTAEILTFFNKTKLQFKLAKGHTKGSIILYSLDKKVVFTGDTVLNNLIQLPIKFPAENKPHLLDSMQFIFDYFTDETIIFPGHGKLSEVKVERLFNKKFNALKKSI